MISDGASNARKAARYFIAETEEVAQTTRPEESGLVDERVYCACHTINLVVQAGLREIKDSLEHVRKLAKIVSNSPKQWNLFKNIQMKLFGGEPGTLFEAKKPEWLSIYESSPEIEVASLPPRKKRCGPPWKVVLDNSTRWNSTFKMLQRFILLRSAFCELVGIIVF